MTAPAIEQTDLLNDLDLDRPVPCCWAVIGCAASAVYEAILERRCPCGPKYLCPYHKEVVLAEDREVGHHPDGGFICGSCRREVGKLIRIIGL